MSRNAMKLSLSLSIMAVLLLGYSNCSNPKVEDSGVNPFSSTSDPNNALEVSPATKTVSLGSTLQLNVAGGTPPYRFSLSTGGGSVDPYSGVYTAPYVDADAIVTVEDVTGKLGQAIIKTSINASSSLTLSYTPAGAVNINQEISLAASGGTAPYTFSMHSGVGAISGSKFIASSFGTAVIAVTDSKGATSTFSILVGSGVEIVKKPIYRLYNASAKQYLFSRTTTEGTSNGYVLQGTSGVFNVLSGTYLASADLIRCYIPSNGGRYLTASGSCGSYTNEGVLGKVWTYAAPNSVPLYNCFKPSTGTYFVSTDNAACTNNGFNIQNTIGWVPQ